MATKHASPLVFRYRIVETWGTFTETVGDADHLLESEYCGPEKEWLIVNTKTMERIGGGWGEFDGTDQVCACGKALITKEHDCP